MRRRAFIAATATGMLGTAAGCLGEPRTEYLARPLEFDLQQAGEQQEAAPGVRWFRNVHAAIDAVEAHRWEDESARQETIAFLEETDDETEEILGVAARGPSRGNGGIEVAYLALDDDVIRGLVRVDDGRPGDEPTYPAALVRISPNDGLPTLAVIEVVDGRGETEEYAAYQPLERRPDDSVPIDLPGDRRGTGR